MPETFDCIVLGVGGFGSAALCHLAEQGVRALGIEQYDVPHDRGSSHGQTRVIRQAYFEHPDYVPLMLSAYDLWSQLEANTGESLYTECGLLIVGSPDGEAIAGARLAAERHGLVIEAVSRDEAATRFPGFRFPDGFEIVYEPRAGFLDVEGCVRVHAERATQLGAVLKTGETVYGWDSDGVSVTVRTDRAEYHAASLIITAGPWATRALQGLDVPLEVVRKPLYWFPTKSSHYDVSASAPAWYFEMPTGAFYGFPSIDGKTVKAAEHTGGQSVGDPDGVDRSSFPEDESRLTEFFAETMPDVELTPAEHAVCLYTRTPDQHFVVDRHPELPNVVIGAGFSGHGFKFTSVIGQALAQLADVGRTDHPIEFLSIERPALQPDD